MDPESQTLIEQPSFDRLRWVPVLGLTISFYSALFATCVLYPWHLEISEELAELSRLVRNSTLIS